MPRVNLLIADDVGLGKTIEAGLVAQELLLRHRARTILIACPADLCLKWQQEMAEKFGLDFHIANAETTRLLRRERGVNANIFGTFPRMIVSIDWLKLRRARSMIRRLLPVDARLQKRRFDLLIVDEVHTCAPSARGQWAKPSLKAQTIRELAPHFEHSLK